MRISTMLSAAALLLPVTAAAQVLVPAGQYEMTVTMAIAGVPGDAQRAVEDAAGVGQGQKRLECFEKDIADAKALMDMFVREIGDTCSLSNPRTKGNTFTVAVTCQADGMRMTGTSETTFVPGGFSTVSRMTIDGGVSTMSATARRVGACPK